MSTSYTVSSSGLAERDFATLHGLLSLSSTSERVYCYLGEGVFEADIIIVNVDLGDSIQKVIDGRSTFEGTARTNIPPAIVAEASAYPAPLSHENQILLKLPIVNSRIMPLLDLLVIDNTFGYDDRTIEAKRRASTFRDYRKTANGT